jgi:hypothetical protein
LFLIELIGDEKKNIYFIGEESVLALLIGLPILNDVGHLTECRGGEPFEEGCKCVSC